MNLKRIAIYLFIYLTVIALVVAIMVVRGKRMMIHSDGTGDKNGVDVINGASIYLSGNDIEGNMIPIQGGPSWYFMEGRGCIVCHGDNARGGKPIRDIDIVPPDINELLEEKGYMTPASFKRQIKWGITPDGKELSWSMPRFDLTERQIKDIMEYIKGLD